MASILSVEQLQGLNSGSSPNTITVPAGQKLHVPGTIIQVEQALKQDHQTVGPGGSNPNYVDVSNLSVTITPKFANSKFLVFLSASLSHCDSDTGHLRLMRDSTPICIGLDDVGTNGGFPPATFSVRQYSHNNTSTSHYISHPYVVEYLDAPNTANAITYKCQIWSTNNTHSTNVNRPLYYNNTTDSNMGRQASVLTVKEIAQ